jgi:hypothetical protein
MMILKVCKHSRKFHFIADIRLVVVTAGEGRFKLCRFCEKSYAVKIQSKTTPKRINLDEAGRIPILTCAAMVPCSRFRVHFSAKSNSKHYHELIRKNKNKKSTRILEEKEKLVCGQFF